MTRDHRRGDLVSGLYQTKEDLFLDENELDENDNEFENYELLQKQFDEIELMYKKLEKEDFAITGYETGYQGYVLFCREKFMPSGYKFALKFSPNIKQEIRFIEMIKRNGYPRNVITTEYCLPIQTSDYEFGTPIELIEGSSLEEILIQHISKRKKGNSKSKYYKLDEATTLRYGFDILNGLIEMRNAGIKRHRDIRPANIMIDKKNKRAVIIDLGVATKEDYIFQKYNNRYGGRNDLISVGQVIYRMGAGEHLFADSPEMERTMCKFNIKTERDKVYEDETGNEFKKYLKKVMENIESNPIKEIIINCLISNGEDHQKIFKIFQKYSRLFNDRSLEGEIILHQTKNWGALL